MSSVKIIKKDTVFQGYFRIDRYRLQYRTYGGEWSGEMVREVFERGHAAAVLLYDPDRDAVALIEQFRVGALAAGWENPWLLEVVAGIIEEGETAEDVARREAEEEAGCSIGELLPVVKMLATPGGSSESLSLYCARVDSTKMGGIHGLADEHEDIKVVILPFDDILEKLKAGEIQNATALVALQWLALNHEDVRSHWLGN